MTAGTVELAPGLFLLIVFEFTLAGWVLGYASCLAVRARLRRIMGEELK